MGIFFLTVYVPVKISRISLDISYQVVHVKVIDFLAIIVIFIIHSLFNRHSKDLRYEIMKLT